MGVAVLDALGVARTETRRYLRWRPLRRWLLGIVLLSILWSLAALSALELADLLTDAATRLQLRRFVFAAWYALPTAIGLIVVLSLTPRLIADATRRGALLDLYLTERHPLGIVLGKLVCVALLTALLMLAALPPCALAAVYVGTSPLQWGKSLLVGWVSLWLPIAIVARLQWRIVPEPDGWGRRRLAPTPAGATLTVLIALLVYTFLHSSAHTPIGAAFLMTSSILLPFGAAIYAGSAWTLGTLSVPVSVVATAVSLSGALAFTTATAQWLGWWSASGYWLQRGLGGLWLLGLTGLCAAFHVEAGVPGERVYYYGVLYAGAAGYLLARFVFGFYGVGKPLTAHEGWLSVLLEWALLWLLAGILYSTFGAMRSAGLSPLWASAVAFYYWSLLVWVQSCSLEQVATRRAILHGDSLPSLRQRIVLELCSVDRRETAMVLSAVATLYIYTWGLTNPLVLLILYYPLLLTPLGGLLRADFASGVYALYGLYALGAAALVVRWRQQAWKARRCGV